MDETIYSREGIDLWIEKAIFYTSGQHYIIAKIETDIGNFEYQHEVTVIGEDYSQSDVDITTSPSFDLLALISSIIIIFYYRRKNRLNFNIRR